MSATPIAALTLLLAAAGTSLLVVVKVVHWRRSRSRAKRRSLYTEAIADLLTTSYPSRTLRRAAGDGVLLDVIHEYLGTLTGHEHAQLLALVGHLDIRRRLRRRALYSPLIERRLAAGHLLADLATPSDEAVLLHLLDARSPGVRSSAARGLARISSRSGLDRILDRIATETPGQALLLAGALVDYGPQAAPAIAERLLGGAGPAPLLLRLLGLIGDREAGAAVAAYLTDPDPECRIAAASALGATGTTDTLAPLLAAAGDPDWRVRARVAASLGDLGHGEAAEMLLRLLEDPSWWVRQNAAAALAKLPSGDRALVAALDSADRFAVDAARERIELSFPELVGT